MKENDLRDMERIFAQVEDPRMERTKLHRLPISLFWRFVESCAEQMDGEKSKNSGKQKKPFLQICSSCPMGFRRTIPLDESLP